METNPLFQILKSKQRFVIAEIGSNHNGKYENAEKLILESKLAGADSVKFQFFRASDLIPESNPEYMSVQKLETPLEWFDKLQSYANKLEIGIFASAFNEEFIKELVAREVFALKIASSEVTNFRLMSLYSKFDTPLIVSFGMSEWYEVEIAMSLLTKFGKKDIIPMHCVSNYPLETEDINLNVIASLKERFGEPVGFSDHSMSIEVGAWAFCFGARVIEKHITLDKNQEGPDHHYALEPHEFKRYVKNIADLQKAVGSARKTYSVSEIGGRGRFGCYATRDINPGDILDFSMIEMRSPRLGIPANLVSSFVGSKVRKLVRQGEYIAFSDLEP